MKKSVDIALGTAPEVYQLFSYSSANLALCDVIAHGFNQTLERDGYHGSWAEAYITSGGTYRLKMTSPKNDLSGYEKKIKNYLAAGRVAMELYNAKVQEGYGFSFLLPFGLAMNEVSSVQLFHFPPNETLFYSDYLYSPTNRRWECLLAQNGFDGKKNASVERIVDVVPIAAAGGAMKEIAPYNVDFIPYGKKQLRTFLEAERGVTQPIVAYGGPVREWLWDAYQSQLKKQYPKASPKECPLRTMDLIQLEIVRGAKTWVLCANHPSMYLYDTTVPVKKAFDPVPNPGGGEPYPAPATVMRDDLVAAGWQAAMASNRHADPEKALAGARKRWASDAKVKPIIIEQNAEFGFGAAKSQRS